MTSSPARVMRNGTSSLFLTAFCQPEMNFEAKLTGVEESIKAALESDTEGLLFKPTTGQDPAPAVNPLTSNMVVTAEMSSAMRKMAEEDARHIFEQRPD